MTHLIVTASLIASSFAAANFYESSEWEEALNAYLAGYAVEAPQGTYANYAALAEQYGLSPSDLLELARPFDECMEENRIRLEHEGSTSPGPWAGAAVKTLKDHLKDRGGLNEQEMKRLADAAVLANGGEILNVIGIEALKKDRLGSAVPSPVLDTVKAKPEERPEDDSGQPGRSSTEDPVQPSTFNQLNQPAVSSEPLTDPSGAADERQSPEPPSANNLDDKKDSSDDTGPDDPLGDDDSNKGGPPAMNDKKIPKNQKSIRSKATFKPKNRNMWYILGSIVAAAVATFAYYKLKF